ncbi:MAG TPA: histone deacetylase [Vicinamibacterales bacterium]|nr:histone deacetylase [Vicinamibacterales bacterium]
MRVVYSARYEIDLPGHIWPTSKYRLIAERLLGDSLLQECEIVAPRPASWDDLALVHTAEYLDKLRRSTLTPDEIATLELPWRAELADAFRLMAGGTCDAALAALEDGAAVHLGGGLHHAFAAHGEGFCPLNDIAIAIRVLQRDRGIRRAAVVDCDVHHGNGTAMIFERDPDIFTFSIHQQHNYPVFKPRSDLDIGLDDGAGDELYLSSLASALTRVIAHEPEMLVYVAGADPYVEDRLGGLALTKPGLRERDRRVIAAARAARVPIVVVLAGGYAADVHDTVDVHVGTVEMMLDGR